MILATISTITQLAAACPVITIFFTATNTLSVDMDTIPRLHELEACPTHELTSSTNCLIAITINNNKSKILSS
jgi:hypothetical protein